MSDFQIDAAILTDKQSCLRKVNLSQSWRLSRFRPKTLFDMLLRRGILQLSASKPIEQVASEARAAFLEKAAEPGLDLIGRDPYQAAKGWISLLEAVLYGLARTQIPVLHDPLPAKLTGSTDWKFLSWADDSGQLHRWVTVDQLEQNTIFKEMHSWRTFGDLVMARTPMVLHFIVIGQQKELGKFSSAWCRTWQFPNFKNRYWLWNKPEQSGWKAVYRIDTDWTAEEWIDKAWEQKAIAPLLEDILVEEPPEHVRLDTLRQIAEEAVATKQTLAEDWRQLPMSRGACDLFLPCAYQNVCFCKDFVDIESLGLYSRRKVPVLTGG